MQFWYHLLDGGNFGFETHDYIKIPSSSVLCVLDLYNYSGISCIMHRGPVIIVAMHAPWWCWMALTGLICEECRPTCDFSSTNSYQLTTLPFCIWFQCLSQCNAMLHVAIIILVVSDNKVNQLLNICLMIDLELCWGLSIIILFLCILIMVGSLTTL